MSTNGSELAYNLALVHYDLNAYPSTFGQHMTDRLIDWSLKTHLELSYISKSFQVLASARHHSAPAVPLAGKILRSPLQRWHPYLRGNQAPPAQQGMPAGNAAELEELTLDALKMRGNPIQWSGQLAKLTTGSL
ncbi:hypothetical protein ZHAS_00017125 [Anopheles sinensis]|uniref:Uncharacterized protein n=1 Tax=Anopheles sinensis TaxID=74873 RepID=A0A084WF71_ANOSI|nr:hypothetical protein ZHAS_00017125 [Anopheles sinensis]